MALVETSFVSTEQHQDVASQVPLKALQAVDIYKQSGQTVVNSYIEQTLQEQSLLDKLKGSFSLGGIGDMINTASSVMQMASQGAAAFNALRSGGLGGLIGGIPGIGNLKGLGGVMPMIGRAAGMVNGLGSKASLLSKGMSLAGLAGFNSSPLTRLMSSSQSLLSSISRMGGLGGLAGLGGGLGGLKGLASASGLASLATATGLTNNIGTAGLLTNLAIGFTNGGSSGSSGGFGSFGGASSSSGRSANSFAQANGLGNFSSVASFSGLGRLTDVGSGFMSKVEGNAAASYLGSLTEVGQFYTGQSNNIATSLSHTRSSITSGVDTVIANLTGKSNDEVDERPIYLKDKQGASTLVAAVALTSTNAGVTGSFARIAKEVKDVSLVKSAAMPLLDIASKTGNLALADEVRQAAAAVNLDKTTETLHAPALAAGLLKNAVFDTTIPDKDLNTCRRNMVELVEQLDPKWKEATYRGKPILSAQATRDNPFLGELFQAGVNTAKQGQAFMAGSSTTTPIAPDDAYLVAATSFDSHSTSTFAGDKIIQNLFA